MTKATEDVLADALRLDPDSRAQLAAELLASLDGPADPDAEQAWQAEIARRVADLEAGKLKLEAWAEAKRRIEKKILGRSAGTAGSGSHGPRPRSSRMPCAGTRRDGLASALTFTTPSTPRSKPSSDNLRWAGPITSTPRVDASWSRASPTTSSTVWNTM